MRWKNLRKLHSTTVPSPFITQLGVRVETPEIYVEVGIRMFQFLSLRMSSSFSIECSRSSMQRAWAASSPTDLPIAKVELLESLERQISSLMDETSVPNAPAVPRCTWSQSYHLAIVCYGNKFQTFLRSNVRVLFSEICAPPDSACGGLQLCPLPKRDA